MKNIKKIVLIVIFILLGCLNTYKLYNKIKYNKDLKSQYVSINSNDYNTLNNDKLIYTTGKIKFDGLLEDKIFNVGVETIKLQRIVEMYQYVEKYDENGYTYESQWSNDYIDSNNFENKEFENINNMIFDNETYYNDAYIGIYKLTTDQIDSLGASSRYLDLDEDIASKYNLNIQNGYLTTCDDIYLPEIGDIRISFKYNISSFVSILARQNNMEFDEFLFNDISIKKILNGKINPDEMLDEYLSDIEINIIMNLILIIFVVIVCFKIK